MKKIKDVIRITGLSRRTLQYYDEQCLVVPKRTKENYRLYSENDLWKLWKILIYKEMGFQLDEITILIETSEEKFHCLLEQKLSTIQNEMEELSFKYRFVEKVLRYGIPDKNIVERIARVSTYKEMIKCLAEKCC